MEDLAAKNQQLIFFGSGHFYLLLFLSPSSLHISTHTKTQLLILFLVLICRHSAKQLRPPPSSRRNLALYPPRPSARCGILPLPRTCLFHPPNLLFRSETIHLFRQLSLLHQQINRQPFSPFGNRALPLGRNSRKIRPLQFRHHQKIPHSSQHPLQRIRIPQQLPWFRTPTPSHQRNQTLPWFSSNSASPSHHIPSPLWPHLTSQPFRYPFSCVSNSNDGWFLWPISLRRNHCPIRL